MAFWGRVLGGISILAFLASSAFGSTTKTVVLGKLGQATRPMGIHAWTSTKSHVYWQIEADQYLVITKTNKNGHWDTVLLQNGHQGYVPSDSISILPFLVTRKVTPEALASRGGGYEVATQALQYIGTKYVWGGNSLQSGIDCSGFVKKLFGQIGENLPRTAAQQALVGQPVLRYQDLQVGDRLYFWENKRNEIGHTGIYIGNGQFVHSSMGHHGVAVDYLTPSWKRILVAARR